MTKAGEYTYPYRVWIWTTYRILWCNDSNRDPAAPAFIVYRAPHPTPGGPPSSSGGAAGSINGSRSSGSTRCMGWWPSEDLCLLLLVVVGTWTRCIVHGTAEGWSRGGALLTIVYKVTGGSAIILALIGYFAHTLNSFYG